MKNIDIIFEGAIARDNIHGCNFLKVTALDKDGDEIELYDEYLVPEDDFDEDEFDAESLKALKAELVEQAREQELGEDVIETIKNFKF